MKSTASPYRIIPDSYEFRSNQACPAVVALSVVTPAGGRTEPVGAHAGPGGHHAGAAGGHATRQGVRARPERHRPGGGRQGEPAATDIGGGVSYRRAHGQYPAARGAGPATEPAGGPGHTAKPGRQLPGLSHRGHHARLCGALWGDAGRGCAGSPHRRAAARPQSKPAPGCPPR